VTVMTSTQSPWLTPTEAADYLKVSKETLRRYVTRGLKKYGTGTGQRFLREDLDQFMRDRS